MLNASWDETYNQYRLLCHKLSYQYKNIKLDYDERYNIALLGLWKAWKDYDETKGASFLTYANYRIRQEFNLIYRDSNAKKRQHNHHLDINHQDDNGNIFSEIIEDDSCRSLHHLNELVKYLDEFSLIASDKGLMFIDKVNGVSIDDIMNKYHKAKRTAYKHIEIGKKEFLKYLEEKDVWL